MPRTTYLFTTAVLAVLVPMFGADNPRVAIDATARSTILLAQIDSAEPSAGCTSHPRPNRCFVRISGRVTRVLKDARLQGLVPEAFEVEVPRYLNGMVPAGAPWAGWNVEAGQQYLIFSDLTSGLPAMIKSPTGSLMVTDDEDAVADVDLILNSGALSLREQASAASAVIRSPGKPRSLFMSQYAAAILAAGSDADTAQLADSIENSRESVFSDMAKGSLLSSLWDRLRQQDERGENLLRVFVTMTARYLIGPVKTLDQSQVKIKPVILRNYLPWILSSERAMVTLRTRLEPGLAGRIREEAHRMAADDQLPAEYRTRFRQLLELLSAR